MGGGAIFEGSCVCTQLKYYPSGTDGSATVSNICRQKTPQGKLVVANATIVPKEGQPGKFEEKFVSQTQRPHAAVRLEPSQSHLEDDCSGWLLGFRDRYVDIG